VITRSAEFRRVVSVARRDPAALLADPLRDAATNALRLSHVEGCTGVVDADTAPKCATCGCPLRLKHAQAAALVTAARRQAAGGFGAFLPMGVGIGKTLVWFLLPTVLEAKRAVVLMPGGLLKVKETHELPILRRHWKETSVTLLSYERIGRKSGEDLLELYQPDLVIGDECHALRNRELASCAKVVEAYRERHRPFMCMMSGTVTGGSLMHYAHLARWCLGEDGTFLPNDFVDLEAWCCAVDADIPAGMRIEPGPLLEMPHEEKGTKMARARDAIRRRMVETEGVFSTTDSSVNCSIYMNAIEVEADAPMVKAFDDIRSEDWLLPNGEECWDALEVHGQARRLGCGYFSYWDPAPPDDWYNARKAYTKLVRKVIRAGDCNTEVGAREVLADTDELAAWFAVKDTFKPNPVPGWISTATLEAAAAWGKRVKAGVIWTQHVPFGERLERDFGIPYFREKGYDSRGRFIEQASGVICASVYANGTGRNLQFGWHTNLVVSPYGSAERWEQKLGRTHRDGQKADAVTCDNFIVCAEHVSAMRRARERAKAIQQLTKNPQKLAYCDWNIELAKYTKRDESRWISRVREETDDDEQSEDVAI
jgi:hypothetical protein